MSSAEEIAVQALQAVDGLPVYPDQAPRDASPPYAVYQAVGGQVVEDLDNDPDSLQNTVLQVAIWSLDKPETVTLMDKCRRALMAVGARPTGGAVSNYESDTKRFGRMLDFSIWF